MGEESGRRKDGEQGRRSRSRRASEWSEGSWTGPQTLTAAALRRHEVAVSGSNYHVRSDVEGRPRRTTVKWPWMRKSDDRNIGLALIGARAMTHSALSAARRRITTRFARIAMWGPWI